LMGDPDRVFISGNKGACVDDQQVLNFCISSTDDELSGSEFNYTNPVSEALEILSPLPARSEYKIFDMIGRTIISGVMKSNEIDVTTLINGTYIVRIDSPDNVFIFKIIKQ